MSMTHIAILVAIPTGLVFLGICLALLLERKYSKKPGSNDIAPGFDARMLRGMGLGSWEKVNRCEECSTTGLDVYGLSLYGPCPKCGSTRIVRRIGRWRNRTWEIKK